MQTNYDVTDSKSYIVTANDAHGFPELYIKGYGWVCFEPTRTAEEIEKEKESITTLLSRSGLVILGISLIVLLFIFLLPVITHKLFLVIVRRKSSNEAVTAVIRRICKVYGIPRTSSVHEAEAAVYRRSAADISAAVILFERAEYGGCEMTEEEKTKAIDIYITAYDALGEAVKAERRAKRNKKHKA